MVDGVEGIRLSDASEGNWKGFEGRDDRSLFEGDRLQIIIRLHVGHSVSVRRRLRWLTLNPLACWVFTLAVKSETYETHSVYIDLTFTIDPYYRLRCKTPADYKNEVGRRNGEDHEEIHSGAFTEYHLRQTWTSYYYTRERS